MINSARCSQHCGLHGESANVGIRQAGDDDLVLIVAYPAP
jgi:hypothetical protein